MDVFEHEHAQAQALPVSEDGSPVQQYLREVRRQAEHESSVYYREVRTTREPAAGRKRGATAMEGEEEDKEVQTVSADITVTNTGGQVEFAAQWAQELLQTFEILKQAIGTARHARGPEYIPETANQWRKYVLDSDPPSIAYFYTAIDRPTVFKLVVYFTKWLSLSANAHLSQWIWMVLLRIDRSMDAGEMAVIRDLGKKAAKLCARAAQDNTNIVARGTFDMVLVLVAHYYGQRDLLGSGLLV